jgi:hypothetical protein
MSKNESSQQSDQLLSVISAVAEQRRQQAQPVLERRLPEWILEVVRSEVAYTLNPRMLPIKQASFPILMRLLEEKYSMKFAPPDLGPFRPNAPMSPEELGSALMGQLSDRHLRFENGRFPKSRNDFDVVESIRINQESILVSVQGISEIANLVVADVAEMIWVSTGVQKSWDEVKQGVQLIGYGTATLVDLGFPSENFIDVKFLDFIRSEMLSGKKFACEMARHSARHNFLASPSLSAIFGLDDLNLNFFTFDNVTGRSETVKFRFSVITRDSVGTGRLVVMSELPFDKHVECLEMLIGAMKA